MGYYIVYDFADIACIWDNALLISHLSSLDIEAWRLVTNNRMVGYLCIYSIRFNEESKFVILKCLYILHVLPNSILSPVFS